MKKTFKMENLDCANCAAKMEAAIGKIEGVQGVSVNFMAQRLAIEASEEEFSQLLDQVEKTCRKIEPSCKILIK